MIRRRRTTTPPPPPAGWEIHDEYRLSPRVTLHPGDVIRVQGENGKRFRFRRHVVSRRTQTEWLDVFDLTTKEMRSFRPDRARRVSKVR